MEVSGQLHVPTALPPGTHWNGGGVGTTAGLDAVAGEENNSLSLPGI